MYPISNDLQLHTKLSFGILKKALPSSFITKNGRIYWTLSTSDSMSGGDSNFFGSSDIVIVDNEIIFSNSSSIFSYNLINGYLNWKVNIGSKNTPIIDGNNVFLLSDNGYFVNLNRKSGFRVIIPFQTLQQKVVYVDIGWIQYKQKDNINLNFVDKDKIFKISGTLLFSEERKVFTPENDYVNNTWFLLNIDEMNLKHNLKASNYILKLKNQKYFKELLIEFNPTNISNNHLEYAITWFSLAISIFILYLYFRKKYY